LTRVHERRFNKGGPGRARRAFEGSRPLARDRVNDVGARDGVFQVSVGHERRRQDSVQRRAEPSTANWEKKKANALVSQLHGARRSGVDVERYPRPPPRGSKTHERYVVMAFCQSAGQGARLRFGPSDR
jgi:hypothetical protein